VATIWAAFLLSRFVRFALEEDIYPRLPMGRGLPYAISSLLHYVILLLGFLVAIATMGVDVNRLTLLTGAFGVGVGFGLQTIVNNFISGLILLLDRAVSRELGSTLRPGLRQVQSDQAGHEDSHVDGPAEALQHGQRARPVGDGDHVPVAEGGQGDIAEVEQILPGGLQHSNGGHTIGPRLEMLQQHVSH